MASYQSVVFCFMQSKFNFKKNPNNCHLKKIKSFVFSSHDSEKCLYNFVYCICCSYRHAH